ncbi:MAG: glutathione synthase [Burkholderiales bacterium]|jgi:glutathione synthase|nr:glutathione synthase [Burkholderiales bacterium]
MKILFVVDPLPKLKAYKDTSVAMMREAQARGHHVYSCDTCDLSARSSEVTASVHALRLFSDPHEWYSIKSQENLPVTAFDAILMRKDPPFDLEYLYATYLLELAETKGVVVVNKPQSLRDYNEKTAILRFPEFIVPTLVTREPAAIDAFIDEFQDVVLKPLNGMGGASIFRVRKDDVNRHVIVETMNQKGETSVMAQQFIPKITEGDKRILVINGEVIPYALARIPKEGETRGNLAAGGRGVAMPITSRERAIAEGLSATLKAAGLFLVGLDVIGGYLTEINVTSPTCFVEITEQSSYNVANTFLLHLETLVQKTNGKRNPDTLT